MQTVNYGIVKLTGADPYFIGFEYVIDERDYVLFISQYRQKFPFRELVPTVKVIGPTYRDDGTLCFTTPINWHTEWENKHQHAWISLMQRCEKMFMQMIATGLPREEAKLILPSSLTYIMTLEGHLNAWSRCMVNDLCPILQRFLGPGFKQLDLLKQ